MVFLPPQRSLAGGRFVDIDVDRYLGTVGLELEHGAHVDCDLWDQFGPGAVGVGWDLALLGLGRHLDAGAAVDRAASAAWTASEEGEAFVRRSSDDWGRASIAAGTDQAAAA